MRWVLVLALALGVTAPALRDMGVGGSARQAFAASVADRSRQVTSVSRTTNAIDAFWVNADRYIMTVGYTPATNWSRPTRISNGLASGGTSVHAVARASNRMDIFAVTPNRYVQTAYWNGSAWSAWSQLGSLRVADRTNVHAISPNANQMDLFAVGEDRVVYTNKWTAAAGWSGWIALPGLKAAANTMAYGAYLSSNGSSVQVVAVQTATVGRVIGPPPGQLVTKNWNLVDVNTYNQSTGWSGWETSPQLVLKPETSAFPVSTTENGVIIFGTNDAGITARQSWYNHLWFEPVLISNGMTWDRTTVFAVERQPGVPASTQAVCIGLDGYVYHHATPTSNGPTLTTSGGVWSQIPGSQSYLDASLVVWGPGKLNIFAWRSVDDGVHTATWNDATGRWSGWARLDD